MKLGLRLREEAYETLVADYVRVDLFELKEVREHKLVIESPTGQRHSENVHAPLESSAA